MIFHAVVVLTGARPSMHADQFAAKAAVAFLRPNNASKGMVGHQDKGTGQVKKKFKAKTVHKASF